MSCPVGAVTARLTAALAPVSARRLEVQSAKTLLIGVVLVIGFRLLGKREAAQLNLYDLAMLMALANAVQNAMTGGLGNLPVGLVTSTTIVAAAWAVTRLVSRHPRVEARLVGEPTLLVHDGRLLEHHLRRQRVTEADVLAACRIHGYTGLDDCHLAVLEVDGSISIVPRPSPVPTGSPDGPDSPEGRDDDPGDPGDDPDTPDGPDTPDDPDPGGDNVDG